MGSKIHKAFAGHTDGEAQSQPGLDHPWRGDPVQQKFSTTLGLTFPQRRIVVFTSGLQSLSSLRARKDHDLALISAVRNPCWQHWHQVLLFQSPTVPPQWSRVKIRRHMIAHRNPLSPRTTSHIIELKLWAEVFIELSGRQTSPSHWRRLWHALQCVCVTETDCHFLTMATRNICCLLQLDDQQPASTQLVLMDAVQRYTIVDLHTTQNAIQHWLYIVLIQSSLHCLYML